MFHLLYQSKLNFGGLHNLLMVSSRHANEVLMVCLLSTPNTCKHSLAYTVLNRSTSIKHIQLFDVQELLLSLCISSVDAQMISTILERILFPFKSRILREKMKPFVKRNNFVSQQNWVAMDVQLKVSTRTSGSNEVLSLHYFVAQHFLLHMISCYNFKYAAGEISNFLCCVYAEWIVC